MTRTVLLAALLGTAAASGLVAQGPTPIPPGWALGGSVQLVRWSYAKTPTLSFRATKLDRDALGVDFAFSLFPEAFATRTIVFMTDLGAVGALRTSSVALLARGGASVIAALGSGGGGVLNAYLGVGTIVRISPSLGLRLDVERRFLTRAEPGYGVFVIGLGITSVPQGG